LTNEELEYVIQTGHLPPKFENKETAPQSKNRMTTATFEAVGKQNHVPAPVPVI
jgi:hypothetical protein